ncbi:MAG: nucleotidyltransferase domain-containing protein [Bacteroidetes bacterium]|nr:nucleotidyltransferase domain-containing protein [Bacteroidota bacterium]
MQLQQSYKDEILSRIKKELHQNETVMFAYVFGSFIKSEHFQDVDIAVHFVEPYRLHDIGLLQYNLQQHVHEVLLSTPGYSVDMLDPRSGLPVDLVVMNDLPESNPVLSQDILNEGKELKLADHPTAQLTYRLRSLHQFEDTRYIRSLSEKAFMKRVQENKIGDRNYAS